MTFDTNYFFRLLALSRQVANRCAYFFPGGSRLYVQNGRVLWDGYAALEERQERGELYIEEVIEAPGRHIPQ